MVEVQAGVDTMTHKLPKRKIPAADSLYRVDSFNLITDPIGNARMMISRGTSTAPETIQKMLKLKQYLGSARLLIHTYSSGMQLNNVAVTQPNHHATTKNMAT